MEADAIAYVNGLTTCFADLHDPRVKGRCEHALLDILAIALLAVLSSCDDWPEIELFSASSVVTQVGLEENRRKRGRSAFQRRA
jgi:hypothetical protein